MRKVKIVLIKSLIDRPKDQKDTVHALGLRKINQSVIHNETPQILGMIKKVNHLVQIESI